MFLAKSGLTSFISTFEMIDFFLHYCQKLVGYLSGGPPKKISDLNGVQLCNSRRDEHRNALPQTPGIES